MIIKKKLKKESEIKPKVGDIKIERVFLFLPTRINDDEIRWLEFINTEYEYIKENYADVYRPRWKFIRYLPCY